MVVILEIDSYIAEVRVVVRPLDNRLEDASDKGWSHICKKLKFIGIDSEGALQQYQGTPDKLFIPSFAGVVAVYACP